MEIIDAEFTVVGESRLERVKRWTWRKLPQVRDLMVAFIIASVGYFIRHHH